jgi:hypothetical protein
LTVALITTCQCGLASPIGQQLDGLLVIVGACGGFHA